MCTLYVFAGNNGSGKSTFRSLILDKMDSDINVDTDLIAKNMKLNHVNNPQIKAGKKTIQMIHECIEKKINFSMETTLSGKLAVNQILTAKEKGFTIKMFFLFLQDDSYNLRRIKYRVENGGHNIPKADVFRRKDRSINHFIKLIDALDESFLIDNTGGMPTTVAIIQSGKIVVQRKHAVPSWMIEYFQKKENEA